MPTYIVEVRTTETRYYTIRAESEKAARISTDGITPDFVNVHEREIASWFVSLEGEGELD